MPNPIKGTPVIALGNIDDRDILSNAKRLECMEAEDPGPDKSGNFKLRCVVREEKAKPQGSIKTEGNRKSKEMKDIDPKKIGNKKLSLSTRSPAIRMSRTNLPPFQFVDCKTEVVKHPLYPQVDVFQLKCTAFNHDQYRALISGQK